MTTNDQSTSPSWAKDYSHHHTSTATLAAQLLEIGAALATLGDQPIPTTALDVGIQVSRANPHRDRVAGVELLASALGLTATCDRLDSDGMHFTTAPGYGRPVQVYTSVITGDEYDEARCLAGVSCTVAGCNADRWKGDVRQMCKPHCLADDNMQDQRGLPPGIVLRSARHRMELRAADGRLLGTAIRSRGKDSEWIGWLVDIDDRREVVDTRMAARDMLVSAATPPESEASAPGPESSTPAAAAGGAS